jgi:ABC-type amino acid transport substrate-binding protein
MRQFKKYTLLTLSILFGCLVLPSCNEKKKDNSVLKVGVCADYKPFEYFENGEIVGFDIDLFNEVAKRLSKTAIYEDMSFDAILGALTAKRIDLSISSISITNERQKNYDFSAPYLKGQYALIIKKDAAIKTLKDITTETLGFQAGTTYEARFNKEIKIQFPELKSQVMSKVPDLLQSLRAGRIAAILLGRSEAACIIKGADDIEKVDILFDTPGEEDPGIALPKESALRPAINKILLEMEQDGTIDTLKTKWKIEA